MKTLITGASGFLGKVLVRKLLACGERDIRCFIRDDRKRAPLEEIGASFPDARLEYVIGDLVSASHATHALEGVEVVYHLASSLRGSSSAMFMNNVVASKNLIEASLTTKSMKTMIYVSTIGIYKTFDLAAGSIVTEESPLEDAPEKRDIYTHSKLMQEQLFWKYLPRFDFSLVVTRPGVIYGPGSSSLPGRIGLQLPGVYLHFGGKNILPITYVDNCADAIIFASNGKGKPEQVFNIIDDDLPTSHDYLKMYKKSVRRIRSLRVYYPGLMAMSKMFEWYSRVSKGQLPAFLTPYKSASMWKPLIYSNSKLKAAGWLPVVPTDEAMHRTFEALRQEMI